MSVKIILDSEALGDPDWSLMADLIEKGHADCHLSACCFRMVAGEIREQAEPPKPEVYEHLLLQKRGKSAEAACGKVWIPTPDVTIVGRCPECLNVAEGGWVA